jgi:cold-inducible RNA-binding protein
MNTKLYVGNLPDNIGEAALRELFSQVGQVVSVTRPADRTAKHMRNFVFVEMATAAEAAKAIETYNGHELGGNAIKVSEARAREANDRFRNAIDRKGVHHGRDQFSRGDSRSGFGRGTGLRGKG